MWKVLRTYTKQRQMAEVQCECGVIETRRLDHVLSGRTSQCKKCSCKQTLKNHPNLLFGPRSHKGMGDICLTLVGHYRGAAKRRDILWDVNARDLWNQFLKQKGRCALSGFPITLSTKIVKSNIDFRDFTASLDRKDSNEGYTKDNIQWVHERINYIKRNLTDAEFISWCILVAKNNRPPVF